jgi:hypothetical protein
MYTSERMSSASVSRGDSPGWNQWPVYWSAIWVGALSALAALVIFGLVGTALGAHQLDPASRFVRWGGERFGVLALVFSVFGAFLSFVIGGWVAGKIAGLRRSEPAMLHGAIVWLAALPILLLAVTIGGAGLFGAWYGGLAGTPAWSAVTSGPVDPNAGAMARNAALGAVTALLLGLMGGVIGGWLSSGEPMTLTHYRTRDVTSTRKGDVR